MDSEDVSAEMIKKIAQKEAEVEAALVRARSNAELIVEEAHKEALEMVGRAELERVKLGERLAREKAERARARAEDKINWISGLDERLRGLSGEDIDGLARAALGEIFGVRNFSS